MSIPIIFIICSILFLGIGSYYTFYPNILINCIEKNDVDQLKLHLKLNGGVNRLNYPKWKIYENYTHYTALTYACSIGADKEILDTLINKGAKMGTDDWTFSAMYYLLKYKHDNNLENIEFLLDNGFDPNYIEYSHSNLLKISIEGMINEDIYDKSFHYDIYMMLINYGAVESKADIFNFVYSSNDLILEKFLENPNMDVNYKDNDGNTLLMRILQNQYEAISIDIIKTLLKNGADKTIKNNNFKTALDIASEKNYYDIIELLK